MDWQKIRPKPGDLAAWESHDEKWRIIKDRYGFAVQKRVDQHTLRLAQCALRDFPAAVDWIENH